MLQNARVAAFTVSELLRENQQGGRGITLLPLRLGLAESLQDFKNKIKFWNPLIVLCKLFKTYIANVGYS